MRIEAEKGGPATWGEIHTRALHLASLLEGANILMNECSSQKAEAAAYTILINLEDQMNELADAIEHMEVKR